METTYGEMKAEKIPDETQTNRVIKRLWCGEVGWSYYINSSCTTCPNTSCVVDIVTV